MAVKSILFRGEITSSGIVNFDGDPTWDLKKALGSRFVGQWHKNVKVAKHALTQMVDKDGKITFEAVLKISKDCIRQGIFKEDQPFHNPAIIHAKKIFVKLLSSIAGLTRGYMFADIGIKRKSPVYISDATQTSKNVSTIDVGSMCAHKDKKENPDDKGGTSYHFKESIGGNVTYEFEGAIDLVELQFISLSEIHDRLAVDPNDKELYRQNLENALGSKPSDKHFYIKNTAVGGLPEEGILLNSDQVKILVEGFFQRLIDLEISRGASGRAWLSSLEVMPKKGGLDNPGWTPVKTSDDVVNLVDEVSCAYNEYNEEEALKLYEGIETGKQKKSTIKKDKKESKTAEKE